MKASKCKKYNNKPAIKYLQEGQVIKNYAELCKILKQPVSTGNKKKSQLKEFERYFKYKKEGYKYIIEKIYTQKQQKQDKRKIDKYFGDNIEKIILHILSEEDIFMSKSALFNKINFINSNFLLIRDNKDKLSKKINIDNMYLTEFYNITYMYLKYLLESKLKRLSLENKIVYNETLTIKERFKKSRTASIYEVESIEKYESQAMIEMSLPNKKELLYKNKYRNFNNNVLSKIKTNISNDILYYYISYDLSLKSEEKYSLDKDEYTRLITETNLLLVDKLKDNCKKRQLNQIKKYRECDLEMFELLSDVYDNDNKVKRIKSEYYDAFKSMIEIFIFYKKEKIPL